MPQGKKSNEPAENGGPAFSVPEGWADVLFDNAFKLAEDYTALVAARKANRESLRNLAAQGLLSEDEKIVLAEIYPERTRKGEDEPAAAPDTTPEPAKA